MILNFEIEDYPVEMIRYLNRANTSEYGKFVRCGWYCLEKSTVGRSQEFVAHIKQASNEEIASLIWFGWQCRQQVNKTALDKFESDELQKLAKEIALLDEAVKKQNLEMNLTERLFSAQSMTFLQAQNDNSRWWKERHDELLRLTDKAKDEQINNLTRELENHLRNSCNSTAEFREEICRFFKQQVLDCVDKSKEAKIEQLEKLLIAKEHSAVFKGQVGEEFVRQILAQACPECEIVNKSKETKCGDLHVINGADEFVAIEVKNKDVITAADIKKSVADILHLKKINPARKFAGYIFASLKTRNIPKKGPLLFESIDNIPIIWFACDSKNELEICFGQFVKILFHYHANFCTKLDPNFETFRAAVVKCGKLSQKVTKLLAPLDLMRAQILDIDSEIKTIWEDLSKCWDDK